jgi:hypothetical protein
MHPRSLANLAEEWTSETGRQAALRRWREQRIHEERREFGPEVFDWILSVVSALFTAYHRADDQSRRSLLDHIEQFVLRWAPDVLAEELDGDQKSGNPETESGTDQAPP